MSVFAPGSCAFAGYPSMSNKPTIQAWSTGPYVGYAQGVLRCKCGRTEISVRNNPPWNFDAPTAYAVVDLQNFFGISPANGVVNAATWGVIDYLAVYT